MGGDCDCFSCFLFLTTNLGLQRGDITLQHLHQQLAANPAMQPRHRELLCTILKLQQRGGGGGGGGGGGSVVPSPRVLSPVPPQQQQQQQLRVSPLPQNGELVAFAWGWGGCVLYVLFENILTGKKIILFLLKLQPISKSTPAFASLSGFYTHTHTHLFYPCNLLICFVQAAYCVSPILATSPNTLTVPGQ